jgi:hypothetical protein
VAIVAIAELIFMQALVETQKKSATFQWKEIHACVPPGTVLVRSGCG